MQSNSLQFDMDIKVFFEKKEKWATWEEKEKDLAPYLNKIFAILESEKPDPSVKKEKDLLKAIIKEVKHDYDKGLKKMRKIQKAYSSQLEEIYKMPGCIDELVELLKSYPTIGMWETEMIKEKWYKHYRHGFRKLVKDSSTSEKEIKERDELLTSKCVEIEKVRAKMWQLRPQILTMTHLLQAAKFSLFLASKVTDNKDGSSSSQKESSSRKKFSSGEGDDSSGEDSSFSSGEGDDSSGENSSSASGEDSSSSSRENKRARK